MVPTRRLSWVSRVSLPLFLWIPTVIQLIILIGILGCIPSFIPNKSNMNSDQIQHELSIKYSHQVFGASAASIAIIFPSLLHTIFNHIIQPNRLIIEYICIFSSISLPGISFIIAESTCSSCGLQFTLFTVLDITSIIATVSTILVIVKSTKEIDSTVTLLCLFFSIFYTISMADHSAIYSSENADTLTVYYVFYAISMAILLSLCIVLFRLIHQSKHNWATLQYTDVKAAALASIILCNEIFRFALSPSPTKTTYWSHYSESEIATYLILHCIFATAIFIVPVFNPHPSKGRRVSLDAQRLSHEAKVPLDLMAAGLSILAKKKSEEEANPNDSFVLSSLLGLCKEVRTALGQSPTEDDEIILNLKPTVMAPFLAKQIKVFDLLAAEKEVSVELKDGGPPQRCYLCVDLKLITQVVQNILAHMIREARSRESIDVTPVYVPQVKTALKLPLDASRNIHIGKVVLTFTESAIFTDFSDEDPGKSKVESDVFDSIFELSVQIAAMHGGLLICDNSQHLAGSTYTLELPVFESVEDAMPMKRLSFKEEAVSQKEYARRPSLLKVFDFERSSTDHKHVLIIDDAIMTRKTVAQLVTAHGYTYATADDGAEGVNLIKKSIYGGARKFDVILVDYMMPNVDGPTAIEIIRSMGYVGLVIGMTGAENSIQEFLSRGANDVIMKPISSEKISKAFAKLRDIRTKRDLEKNVRRATVYQT